MRQYVPLKHFQTALCHVLKVILHSLYCGTDINTCICWCVYDVSHARFHIPSYDPLVFIYKCNKEYECHNGHHAVVLHYKQE
jgi:hypothetical protein